jgi:hypothetical protein
MTFKRSPLYVHLYLALTPSEREEIDLVEQNLLIHPFGDINRWKYRVDRNGRQWWAYISTWFFVVYRVEGESIYLADIGRMPGAPYD